MAVQGQRPVHAAALGHQRRRQRQRDAGLSVPAADRDHNPRQQLADTNVFLFPLGDVRLPNLFVADFRVDKAFTFGGMRIIPSLDIFNLTNSSEILSRRRPRYSFNATTAVGSSSTTLPPNNISSIIAPRVIRFGAQGDLVDQAILNAEC